MDSQAYASNQRQPRLINIEEISPNEPYQRLQAAADYQPRQIKSPRRSSSILAEDVTPVNNWKYQHQLPAATLQSLYSTVSPLRPLKLRKKTAQQIYYTQAPVLSPVSAVRREDVSDSRKVRRQDELVDYADGSNESGGASAQQDYDHGNYQPVAEDRKDEHKHYGKKHEEGHGGEHHEDEHDEHGDKGEKVNKKYSVILNSILDKLKKKNID